MKFTFFAQTTAPGETAKKIAETAKVGATKGEEGGIVQQFVDTFVSMGNAAAAKAPYILIGVTLFIAGLIIAKIIRKVVHSIGDKVGLDAAAEKVGVKDMLSKIGIRDSTSKFIASILYYVLLLFFIKVSADFMGIDDLSGFIDSVIAFIPKVMVAFLILMSGLLAADLVRKMVETGLDKIGIEYSSLIANFVYGLLGVMILTVVLGQIGIQTELLNAAVKIFLGAGSLAVAIALGFGLRPIAKNVVAGVYARDSFPPGSVVEVNNTPARVVEVGAISTRLENENGDYFVAPNYMMVSQLQKGTSRRNLEISEKKHG